MAEKILIVEDELTLLETLSYSLTRQGYEVETAGDGRAALEKARATHPDLIILDVMLPIMDGFEVCRILRNETNATILMLTARDDEIDRVIGLELGADDYVTKPFSLRELIARIKAHLRRVKLIQQESGISSDQDLENLQFGELTLNVKRHEVILNGRPIGLKPKEFELLLFLARHRGQALSRDLILERVWGWEFSGGSRTVDVHISGLREKLEKDPGYPVRIITVRGAGYRFEG